MKNYLTYIGTISFITLSVALVADIFIAFGIFILATAYGLFLEVE
ncbi:MULTISPECIES: hypothetical protein [Staphylococcus]|uniref:DUF1270 family protein n=1 Tax=Staphylococcus pasteuri_A TaxID=3062664 RepID=A0AAW7YNQ9_9STAP|nr:hypothetical protein [Staphylococcus pasteuri_A]MDO6572953.1 hypothetical protein [Staphylococcus pasteuri_A]